jgi:hypothetical protein
MQFSLSLLGPNILLSTPSSNTLKLHTLPFTTDCNWSLTAARWIQTVQWLQWPIMWTTMANTAVKELLIQVFCHVSTEMCGAPSHWNYFHL